MLAQGERFYRVYSDYATLPNQWFLGDPRTVDDEEIDARDFTEARPYEGPLPAHVPVKHKGKEVAFSLSAFDMPIVATTVANAIQRLAPGEAQFFPVAIPAAKGQYQILNVNHQAECLDETRSEFTIWTEEDNNPEMLGNYRMITTIRIDPARTGGHHIFRIARWTLALLVSDTLKNAIDEIPNLGVVFEPVV